MQEAAVPVGADLEEARVEIGRDRFFELLAEKDLLVLPKVERPRTTSECHET
jgi:hypothetical protein